MFSRGDRHLTPVLINAWKNGARFDSWTDQFRHSIWEEAFVAENMDYMLYLAEIDEKAALPWDHIDTRINKAHLLEERRLSQAEEFSQSCSQETLQIVSARIQMKTGPVCRSSCLQNYFRQICTSLPVRTSQFHKGTSG